MCDGRKWPSAGHFVILGGYTVNDARTRVLANFGLFLNLGGVVGGTSLIYC